MRPNRLKDCTRDGRVAYGIGLSFNSPDLVEYCGELGFDFVFIDGEHGGATPEMCRELQRAADAAAVETIVRVPRNDGPSMVPYLENGTWNLIVPHVNTPADAESAVRATRYSPAGERGAASSTRAARFGIGQSPNEYFVRANEQVLLLPMIEEVEALRNLEAIAAVEGIDAAFVGPQDLSLSMQLPGLTSDPAVRRAAEDAMRRLSQAGLIVGAPASTLEDARRLISLGVQLIVTSAAGFLGAGARAFLAEAPRSG